MNVTKNFMITFLIVTSSLIFSENLKPYILASKSNEPLEQIVDLLQTRLTENNFEILGQYSPAGDEDRLIIIVTNADLVTAVKNFGGLKGFALSLRVALTRTDENVNISYTNPLYWGNAYWGEDFNRVSELYKQLRANFEQALSNIDKVQNTAFGSLDGLTEKKLAKFRYMFGMEQFADVVELNEFESFENAVAVIDNNLKDSENFIYSVELKESKLKLYGIAIGGEKGEGHFLPIIDITSPKHTAFLPYELLIVDSKAVMMHGRYRIALSFPDLTMGTFSKIMSTPGDIKKALKKYTE